MTNAELKTLITNGLRHNSCSQPKLIETHISWVILCNTLAYKIKKPIQYSFLDFSTLEKRLFFCREEIRLNWRLTFNVYLSIVEIRKHNGEVMLGGHEGEVIDYAVCMRRLDNKRQMNRLMVRNLVSSDDIQKLAAVIASFHTKAGVIKQKELHQIGHKFNDLLIEKEYLGDMIDPDAGKMIERATNFSDEFLEKNTMLMESRLRQGFYRDVHGDLHTKNIFILDQPVVFDCIEFSSDYRQIDVLNEIAFLCMDLEAANREDLSQLFLKFYTKMLGLKMGTPETNLFTYYKAFRANVRAKVNSLRARGIINLGERNKVLSEVKKYLDLMDNYTCSLSK